MDHPAAPLLAQDLGRLPHTNNRGERGFVHIPGFMSTAGMSDGQEGEAGQLAQAIAEAVIEDLTKHGYPPTAEADIKARIKAAVESAQGAGELTLYCNRCQQPVVEIDTSAALPKIQVSSMVLGLAKHAEGCK